MTDRICSEVRGRRDTHSREPATPHTLPISHEGRPIAGSQVTYLDIPPDCVDPSHPPIVVAGGIFARAELYRIFFQEVANRYHSHVYVITLPSMTGSHLPGYASIYASTLVDAVSTVIQDAIPARGAFHLVGDSLGGIIARVGYNHPEQIAGQGPDQRHLRRTILANPPRTDEEQDIFGAHIPPSISFPFALGNIGRAHGGARPLSSIIDSVLNAHNPESQRNIWGQISNERFYSSLWSSLDLFNTNNRNPTLFALESERDPGLRYLIATQDHLFRQPVCQNYRGYHCVRGADHGFLIAERREDILPETISDFMDALTGPWTGRPFSRNAAYRESPIRTTGSVASFFNTRGELGFQLRFGAQQPLALWGPLTFFTREILQGSVSTNTNFDRPQVSIGGALEAGIGWTGLFVFPPEMGLQVIAEAHAGPTITSPYTADACGFLRFRFERMLTFGGRTCYRIFESGPTEPPLSLELFAGVPIQ